MLKKLLVFSCLVFPFSCSINPFSNFNDTKVISDTQVKQKSDFQGELILSGKVDFPEKFKTKALLSTDISTFSSIILTNISTKKPEGVGVTDSLGTFNVFSGTIVDFAPVANNPYILEAIKRVSDTGAIEPELGKFVALRTLVVPIQIDPLCDTRVTFCPFTLKTISGNGKATKINKYTTALALLYSKRQITNIMDIIGKISVTAPVAVDIKDSTGTVIVTAAQLETKATDIETAITGNLDPITPITGASSTCTGGVAICGGVGG